VAVKNINIDLKTEEKLDKEVFEESLAGDPGIRGSCELTWMEI
jgi:hypothetical protein